VEEYAGISTDFRHNLELVGNKSIKTKEIQKLVAKNSFKNEENLLD